MYLVFHNDPYKRSFPIAQSCYSVSRNLNNWDEMDVIGNPYGISSSADTFIVVGRYNYGLFKANTRSWRKIFTCLAVYTEQADLFDRICSGMGRFEASVPKCSPDLKKSYITRMLYTIVRLTPGCTG